METVKHRTLHPDNGGSVTVYYCGCERCAAGHFWGPAVRGQYLLHYVQAGTGTYTVGGETYTLHAGECFLIRPGERTVYRADRKDPWTYMWVAFDGFDAAEILRRTGFVGRYTAKVADTGRFESCMRSMIAELAEDSPFQVMSSFYGAMAVLERSAGGAPFSREHEYVDKAVGYMKTHYSYPIRIRDVARFIGIDRTYLYRIFSASERMSPKQYLMQVRIDAAKKMLLSGRYSVGETALSCGFSDAASFCSRFKRVTGMTPKAFAAGKRRGSAERKLDI